ncbi:MAG TPA: sigma-70 family RNA polymerase sigma factor [Pseudogracilibacillus sp.]|nr:sigma-70 family RNA polymerase sigma factor [Pseudogracilibacillus sp.]
MREKLFMQEQRIYYHIHRLRIPYAFHEEFYAEGMIALWQAYESYDASRGELDTHLNAALNFHFIDLIRKNKRASDAQIEAREQLITKQETGNTMTRTNQLLIDPSGIQINDTQVWQQIKSLLSKRQWTWVVYFVIKEYPLKEIAAQEEVSIEAVKSWAKEARRKLRAETNLKGTLLNTIRED